MTQSEVNHPLVSYTMPKIMFFRVKYDKPTTIFAI